MINPDDSLILCTPSSLGEEDGVYPRPASLAGIVRSETPSDLRVNDHRVHRVLVARGEPVI